MVKRHQRVLARLMSLLITMPSILFGVSSPAHASVNDLLLGDGPAYYNTCGRFWPSGGSFSPEKSGDYFRISWGFRLTDSQLGAMECIKDRFGQSYLELDLSLVGFGGQYDWDAYRVVGTNLPGAVHDSGWMDAPANASPGVTGIRVASLVANVSYYVTIDWNTSDTFYPLSGWTPRVSFEWVPSHWSNPLNPYEGPACAIGLGLPAWCIFGGGRAYVSGEFYTFFTGPNVRDGLPFKQVLSYPYYFPPASGSTSGSGGSSSTGSGSTESTPSGGIATYDGVIRIDGTGGAGVNLRSGPYTSASRVGGLPEGTVVQHYF